MISQPTNIAPRFINATLPFELSFTVNGSNISKYAYEVHDHHENSFHSGSSGLALVSKGTPTWDAEYGLWRDNYYPLKQDDKGENTVLYNGESARIPIAAICPGGDPALSNNKSYFLSFRLVMDIENVRLDGNLVGKGVTQAYLPTPGAEPSYTYFQVPFNPNIKESMYVILFDELSQILGVQHFRATNHTTIVLTKPAKKAITDGILYEIRSDFIDVLPEIELLARNSSSVGIDIINGYDPNTYEINSPFARFSGTYSKSDGVEISYYKFENYVYDTDLQEFILVDESEKINNESYKYDYLGFQSGRIYKLIFTVVNMEGNSCTANGVYEVDFETDNSVLSGISAIFNEKNGCVDLSFELGNSTSKSEYKRHGYAYWVRQRKGSVKREVAAYLPGGTQNISDFNIFGDEEYIYTL
jgi:hypothetical protein